MTACVDNIHFFDRIVISKDLTINAYPTYAGNSSLEIRVDCWQDNDLVATALFMNVARDIKDKTKAKAIPQMTFEGETDLSFCKMRS